MPEQPDSLMFSDAELTMLGKTADAFSAYLGTAVLAEVGESDGAQWVIFAKALGQDAAGADGLVHVQVGGPGSKVLGQKGGLATERQAFDCEFLWAIQITDDPEERFVRLDPTGDAVDAAPQLVELLPFSLQEPENLNPSWDDDDTDDPDHNDDGEPSIDPNTPTLRH